MYFLDVSTSGNSGILVYNVKMEKNSQQIDFGFQKVNIGKKEKLVNNIFNSVSSKYDLMNDLSSLGFHRLWKQQLINWIAPQSHQSLLDIAGGTGDIAKQFIKSGGLSADILDIKYNMLIHSKSNDNRIRYIVGNCEKLPIRSNAYERITISFGLRNITNRKLALDEIYRVLKPGGRFMCLEFSKIENELIDFFYKQYAKTIPLIGKFVVGTEKPYEYLIDSIKKFYNQEQLAKLMKSNGFSNVEFRNVSSGVSAIHSGWKI